MLARIGKGSIAAAHTHTHTLGDHYRLLLFSDARTSTQQASVISDIVVLYMLKGRQFYRRKKYQDVIDPINAYESLDNSSEEDSQADKPAVPLASNKSDKF